MALIFHYLQDEDFINIVRIDSGECVSPVDERLRSYTRISGEGVFVRE